MLILKDSGTLSYENCKCETLVRQQINIMKTAPLKPCPFIYEFSL